LPYFSADIKSVLTGEADLKKIVFPVLVLVVIIIGLLHFFTPGHLVFYHDTYRRLSYFPIVLGGIWFGIWGGVFLAAMSSIAFIPHLLLYLGQEPDIYLSELTEIILYFGAGTLIGLIARRQARLRESYRLLSEKLKKSYSRLHDETELLLEAEEQLSASQKLSALGQLSASLAHEIKNPLSSIKGTAEILLDEFPPEHPKREFVDILLTEVDRLNTTVDGILNYSRDRSGKNFSSEPLSDIIIGVARLLESNLKKKSIDFDILENSMAKDYLIEREKLSQVFLNIILNAIDAVPIGGKIRVRMEKKPEGLTVIITDNGPSIPAEVREQIFLPFYTEKEDGTGLGLPISRKIVESYGGRINVSDANDGGACFTIFLPQSLEDPSLDSVKPVAKSIDGDTLWRS